ncbi:MAG: DNA polymerase III subunit epsilon [Rhodothalassiaceae bacterium]
MREIVFDTETTGLEPSQGHRIVQIGALEIVNMIPTGRSFMRLIDPGRPVDPAAAAVHGLDDEKLRGQPRFADIVEDFLAFIADDPLVAHNAEFDRGFLNAELAACGRPPLPAERFVDTLAIARQRFPGQRASLDALCRMFGIDNSMREKHDALLDCEILARVYLELRGGRQHGLALASETAAAGADSGPRQRTGERRPPRPHAPSDEERAAHARFLETLQSPLWLAAGKD